MLIRNFGKIDVSDTTPFNALGLKGVKRNIYVFVTKSEYEMKTFTHCKMCIENNVVYDTQHNLSLGFRVNDSHIIRTAVYFGDMFTYEPGNIRSETATFVIDNVTTTEKLVVPNNGNSGETVSFSPSIWSKRFYQMEESDYADFIGISGCGNEIISLSPEYYTDFDMNARTGDFTDLTHDVVSKIPMKKLIDNNTTIIFMDIQKYDTIRLDAFKRITEMENNCNEGFKFSNALKSAFNSFVGTNAVFIYDSDAQGYGKSGFNVRGGNIAFGKFYTKQYLSNNLIATLNLFERECKDIEQTAGHVRINYCPSIIGDKLKITFKDHKVSPVTLPAQIENNGIVKPNFSNTAPLSSIDNGYSVDSMMKDILSLTYQNEQETFQEEMFNRD